MHAQCTCCCRYIVIIGDELPLNVFPFHTLYTQCIVFDAWMHSRGSPGTIIINFECRKNFLDGCRLGQIIRRALFDCFHRCRHTGITGQYHHLQGRL